jgi:hypothetical protein
MVRRLLPLALLLPPLVLLETTERLAEPPGRKLDPAD